MALIAPARLSAWMLGRLDDPAWGSTATIGVVSLTSTSVGVTRIEPIGERAAQPADVAPLPAGAVLAVAAARVDDQLVATAPGSPRPPPLSSSALNGSMSATRMPITLVRWLRRLRATRLDS